MNCDGFLKGFSAREELLVGVGDKIKLSTTRLLTGPGLEIVDKLEMSDSQIWQIVSVSPEAVLEVWQVVAGNLKTTSRDLIRSGLGKG